MDYTSSNTIIRSNWVFITLGWIFAVLALFAYPFIFGVLGVIMGILATRNNSRAGMTVILASIILLGVGLPLSGAIMDNARKLLGF